MVLKLLGYRQEKDTVNILTHCNTGWLATIDWGTATSQFIMLIKKELKFMFG